jgi:hypothetical protein
MRMIIRNKFVLSLKDVMIARAYYSSALNSLSNELLFDAPYNMINSIKDSSQDITYNPNDFLKSEKITIAMHHFDQFLLWSCICIFCLGVYSVELKYKNIKSVEKLYSFIDYKNIRRHTTQFIFVLSFILFKNMQNAT